MKRLSEFFGFFRSPEEQVNFDEGSYQEPPQLTDSGDGSDRGGNNSPSEKSSEKADGKKDEDSDGQDIPKSMMDRLNERDERQEKNERKSMMDRLNERDEERERLAKEEQAKLTPDMDVHNAVTQAIDSAVNTPPPGQDKEGFEQVSDMLTQNAQFGANMRDELMPTWAQ